MWNSLVICLLFSAAWGMQERCGIPSDFCTCYPDIAVCSSTEANSRFPDFTHSAIVIYMETLIIKGYSWATPIIIDNTKIWLSLARIVGKDSNIHCGDLLTTKSATFICNNATTTTAESYNGTVTGANDEANITTVTTEEPITKEETVRPPTRRYPKIVITNSTSPNTTSQNKTDTKETQADTPNILDGDIFEQLQHLLIISVVVSILSAIFGLIMVNYCCWKKKICRNLKCCKTQPIAMRTRSRTMVPVENLQSEETELFDISNTSLRKRTPSPAARYHADI